MNKQVGYITSAHLVLAAVIGCYFFISSISFSPGGSAPDISYNTSNNQSTISVPANVLQGKTLFMSKCASCHRLNKMLTGPSLEGFEERGPWSDRLKLYEWIKNPAAFMQKNEYARNLRDNFNGIMMTGFPDLTHEDIDAIVAYINSSSLRPDIIQ